MGKRRENQMDDAENNWLRGVEGGAGVLGSESTSASMWVSGLGCRFLACKVAEPLNKCSALAA